ncbi:MAG: AAA family ATPase [Eubacteriales bacterium]|nr:AAA family ATPase [Eubacteriales bacterium]
MHIKRIELKSFKRFTHLVVENIPDTIRLVVLVGPNGSGKTSFLEAMNHFYKYSGYSNIGDCRYLSKLGDTPKYNNSQWYDQAAELVDIDFYDATFPKNVGDNSDIKGRFYFRSAYRNEPDFHIEVMQRQQNPTETIRLDSLIQNDQTVSSKITRDLLQIRFLAFLTMGTTQNL